SLKDRPEFALVAGWEGGELEAGQLPEAFERAYVQTWVSAEYTADPVLTGFDAAAHDATVERFRTRDATLGASAAQKAHALLAAQTPQGAAGEMAVLRRELQKKARHKPIRRLF